MISSPDTVQGVPFAVFPQHSFFTTTFFTFGFARGEISSSSELSCVHRQTRSITSFLLPPTRSPFSLQKALRTSLVQLRRSSRVVAFAGFSSLVLGSLAVTCSFVFSYIRSSAFLTNESRSLQAISSSCSAMNFSKRTVIEDIFLWKVLKESYFFVIPLRATRRSFVSFVFYFLIKIHCWISLSKYCVYPRLGAGGHNIFLVYLSV